MIVYLRLCLAYFCQFAIWGSWMAALGGYVGGTLEFTGTEIGWVFAAMPIGAIIAPLFIGPLADRYFSTQKVMSVLHLIGGLALLACGWLCQQGMGTFPVLMALMLLNGMCYSPTLALMNSVVFKHLPKPSMGPFVFVFGTIGWFCVVIAVEIVCGGATMPHFFNFFILGGCISVFLALYALTLPDTPPQGAPAAGQKTGGGLAVLSLFKDFSFFIFVLCAFLASIPANNYFWASVVPFLTERGYPSPTGMTGLCQISELVFMLALPFCIPRFGLKNVLLIGMAAWFLRYFLFAEPYLVTAMGGLLLHGFCFAFLYVASYMYAEKVAPAHLKASAQSMMVFLLIGVGQVLGGFSYGIISDKYPPQHTAIVVEGTQLDPLPAGIDATNTSFNVPVPAWSEAEGGWVQYFDLAGLVIKMFPKQEGAAVTTRSVDIGKLLGEKPLTLESISAIEGQMVQDGVKISKTSTCCDTDTVKAFEPFVTSVTYSKDNLRTLGKAIASIPCSHCGHAEVGDDFSVTRTQWLAAQSKDWRKIFHYPAFFILGCFIVFLLLGREPKGETEAPKQ